MDCYYWQEPSNFHCHGEGLANAGRTCFWIIKKNADPLRWWWSVKMNLSSGLLILINLNHHENLPAGRQVCVLLLSTEGFGLKWVSDWRNLRPPPPDSYGAYDRGRDAIPHSYCIEIVHRVSLPKINFLNDTTLSNRHCLWGREAHIQPSFLLKQ